MKGRTTVEFRQLAGNQQGGVASVLVSTIIIVITDINSTIFSGHRTYLLHVQREIDDTVVVERRSVHVLYFQFYPKNTLWF